MTVNDWIDPSIAKQFDRLPPHSIEAEMCLLASMMLDKEAVESVTRAVDREMFYQADHQIIFDVLLKLHGQSRAVDAVIVREELLKRQLLEEVGGAAYLAAILDSVPSAAHAMSYARVVREKALLRQLISASNDVLRAAYAPHEEAASILTDAEKSILRIAEAHRSGIGAADSIQTLESIVYRVLESKENRKVERIPTGLAAIDRRIGGVPVGGLTLIAGRAGMGKSQLGKQIAMNHAKAGGVPLIVSIEESAHKIGENYLSGASGIRNSRIVYNFEKQTFFDDRGQDVSLSEQDWGELSHAAGRLAPLKLYVDDAQQKLSDIARVIRRAVRKHGVTMVFVDHLHLIDAETDANRVQQITMISGGLKNLFKELKIAGVVAAQMNRGGGAQGVEQDAPPELWQLRDSGSLEQDGDLIFQLHRADYYNWKKLGKDFVPDNRLRIYINKSKSGGVGHQDAYFDGDHQQVLDWTSEHELNAKKTAQAQKEDAEEEKHPTFNDARKQAARLTAKFPTLTDKQLTEAARALAGIGRTAGEKIVTGFLGGNCLPGATFDVSEFIKECKAVAQ